MAAEAVYSGPSAGGSDNRSTNSRCTNCTSSSAIAVGNTMPSEKQINAELQKDARQPGKLVQDKVIVISGTRSRDGVWAYTKEPQTSAGEHLVILASGVQPMSKECCWTNGCADAAWG